MFWIALAWVFIQLGGLGVKWAELAVEDTFRSVGISVEYEDIAVVPDSGIDEYSQQVGCGLFNRSLDDNVLTNYVVVALKIRNYTRNPAPPVKLLFDARNSYFKIIDVQHATRRPLGKRIVVEHGLPNLAWRPPTNDLAVDLTWEKQEGTAANVYFSFAPERGYGKINFLPIDNGTFRAMLAPVHAEADWHFRNTGVNEWGESDLGSIISAPNNYYLQPSFKSMEGVDASGVAHPQVLNREKLEFLSGRATLSLPNGLDKGGEIDVYVLGKIQSGHSFNPLVTMDGARDVAFKSKNSAPQFKMPRPTYLSAQRLSLTPETIRVVTALGKNVLFWDGSRISNYAGLKIFRSSPRKVGDFSSVGEMIFEGYGNTNPFTLFRRVDRPPPLTSTATNFTQFFDRAPEKARVTPKSDPRRPQAPRLLKIESSEPYEGYVHFVDSLDSSASATNAFTYTIYAFDASGLNSYPVVVNVAVDSSSANCRYELVAAAP